MSCRRLTPNNHKIIKLKNGFLQGAEARFLFMSQDLQQELHKLPDSPLSFSKQFGIMDKNIHFCTALDWRLFGAEDIEMKYKKWSIRSDSSVVASEIERNGIGALSSLVHAARGCHTAQEVRQAVASGEELLHDPMELAGIRPAVERLRRAIEKQEQICVYGDYDVDGITATCLLTSCLREEGGKVAPYIPDRISEGYSLNNDTLKKLGEQGVQLIVTVDCGITNLEETRYARELGIDVIITDHHECKPELPQAVAVVNPHQPNCFYPFKHLAGVGVALKVAMALTGRGQETFYRYVDLAAIGTVADVMELTGENRAIVSMGLKAIQHTRRVGLAMLLREAGLEGKALTATSLSFSLAPRINAAGRMGCPELAVRLLLTEGEEQAALYARELCELNRERQNVEMEIFNQCAALLEQRPSLREHAIILAGENWHQGVIGIVASRLVEQYRLPTFMICLENGRGKGSCRSAPGFNLFAALEQCSDLLETFGGHEQAAGFTIAAEKLPEFRARILALAASMPERSDAVPELIIDVCLPSVRLLTLPQVEELQRLEPFGTGNPRPTLLLENMEVVSYSAVGGGRHTRLQLCREGMHFDAIFFSAPLREIGLRPGMRMDVAFYPQINEFRGNRTVQLLITDLRRSMTPMQIEQRLYQRYREGLLLQRSELEQLLPSRQDFVCLWRYLNRQGPAPLEESPDVLVEHLAAATGVRQPFGRTMVCLEVFHERGLIELHGSEHQVRVSVRQVSQKVDLNASRVLLSLQQRLEESG